MKIRFVTRKLQKQMSSAREIKRAFGINAKRVQSRLDDIEFSSSLAVLMQIPAANCHALSGDRKGTWALNISLNHRLIFEIDHTPVPKDSNGDIDTFLVKQICMIETTDYH